MMVRVFGFFTKKTVINPRLKKQHKGRWETVFKKGDRVEIVKPKMTWNEKCYLARIGQQGECMDDELLEYPQSKVYVLLDGYKKGIWLKPINIKKI